MPDRSSEQQQQQRQERQEEVQHALLSTPVRVDAAEGLERLGDGLSELHHRPNITPTRTAASDVDEMPRPRLSQTPYSTVGVPCSSTPAVMEEVSDSSVTAAIVLQRWSLLQRDSQFNLQMVTPNMKRSFTAGELGEAATSMGSQRGSVNFERASMATFVFTRNAEESQRKSPPLESILHSNTGDGDVADALFPGLDDDDDDNNNSSSIISGNNSAASGGGRGDHYSEQHSEKNGVVIAQEAEELSLTTLRRFVGASRHAQFAHEGVGHNGEHSASVDATSICTSAQEVSRWHLYAGREVPAMLHSPSSLADKDSGGVGHKARTVTYKFQKLRRGLGDDVCGCDDEEGSEADCSCSCLRGVWGNVVGCCCGRDDKSDVLPNAGVCTNAGQGEHGRRRQGLLCRLCRRISRFVWFLNVFTADISTSSRVFCLINYVSGMVVSLVTFLLLWTLLSSKHTTSVNDGSVCQGEVLREVVTPDLTFSIVCFIINGVFAVCFAVRAVRYENTGLLVCHFIAVLLQICRAVYFVPSTNTDYLSGNMATCIQTLLVFNAFLLLVSCGTYLWVSKSFGWRTFMKGITRWIMLRHRRRHKYVQSCVQLDVVVTINTCVALLFLVDSQAEHVLLLVLVLLSCIVAMSFIPMLRRQVIFFLAIFGLVAALSLGFQCYALSSAMDEYFIRRAGVKFEESSCYRDLLQRCMWDARIRIISCLNREDDHCWIVNGTSTYIPTNGSHREYFEIYRCDALCFWHRESAIFAHIRHCCERYGHCRLKDDARSYGAVHLGVLTVIMILVRMILVRLWFHTIEEGVYLDGANSSSSASTRLCSRRQHEDSTWSACVHNVPGATRSAGALAEEEEEEEERGDDADGAKNKKAREGELTPNDAAAAAAAVEPHVLLHE